MKLHVINSGSVGNCYVLTAKTGERLLIDCGVKFSEIQKAINFDYNSVVACLLTHEHGDHSRSVFKLIEKGITVKSSAKTLEALAIESSVFTFDLRTDFTLSSSDHDYIVTPFEVTHDVPTLGFLIEHPECGQIVFATDCNKLNHLFPDANHYVIEANYCAYKIADRQMNGIGNDYVSERVKRSHLSIQKALHTLSINNMDNVHSITLIHLSDSNSDEGSFRDQVVNQTGKPTYIAKPGMTIDLSINW